MKFEDKSNPYFGGGKMSFREWIKKDIAEMEKEMKKEDFDGGECYGISKREVYTITIAGGGPSMVIEIDVENKEITGGRYIYAWWSPQEIEEIGEEEAETIANYYSLYVE